MTAIIYYLPRTIWRSPLPGSAKLVLIVGLFVALLVLGSLTQSHG